MWLSHCILLLKNIHPSTMAALIHEGAPESALVAAARAAGPSLLDDGLAKLRAGETTVDEVARVTREEGA